MIAVRLHRAGPLEAADLRVEGISRPQAGPGQLLIRVLACGVCHTDLHTVEGDLRPPRLPLTPGHQIVGQVEALGEGLAGWSLGDRAGVPWLHRACGQCAHCRRGEENLCSEAAFTGFHVDGGYAEYVVAQADFALRLPPALAAQEVAPLLCAGIIGYRSLRLAEVRSGERLGLVGFGASAHLALQVARHWGCDVYVFTRSLAHRALARELGAAWVGGIEDTPPGPVDRAVLFAPSGALVPATLRRLRPGGTLAVNAIHMTPIPEMPYATIYGERTLRSVSNATRQDGIEFLELAARIPIRPTTQVYPLEAARRALDDLKQSRVQGAAVLQP
jgi:propanol-preferring alcohol dehydrogenase